MSAAVAGPNPVFWKLQDFTAHKEDVTCVCLGQKTAKIMATGSLDSSVNIWSVNKSQRIMNLTGQNSPITAVNFNISDELLLAGSQAGVIKLWDLQAAKIIRTMSCHKSSVKAFAFHPYADVLATGAADSSLKLWDLRRKGMLYHFKWHKGSITSLCFSPDGMWLASTSEDCSCKLTELKTGSLIADFTDHSASVNSGVFHPNEFLYATGSSDKTVKFWDLETFKLIGSSSQQSESQPIKSVYFEQNGQFLFSGTDNTLKLFCWEPVTKLLDSVVVNWGHIGAMGQISRQIIVANYSKTSVSTHVVDLNRLTSQMTSQNSNDVTTQDNSVSASNKAPNAGAAPSQHSSNPDPTSAAAGYSSGGSRKNFTKEVKPAHVNSNENDDEDNVSQVQIENEDDYQAIFSPKQRLNHSPSRDMQMFRPPGDFGDVPQGDKGVPSVGANVKLDPRPHTSCRSASPKVQQQSPGVPNVPTGRAPAAALKRSPSGRRNSPRNMNKNDFDSSLMAEFDQKIKMQQLEGGGVGAFGDRNGGGDVSFEHVFGRVNRGHETVKDTLTERALRLETVRGLLSSSTADPFIAWKRAAEDAIMFNDHSITNDILSVLNQRQSVWSLDLVTSILPSVVELCRSKHAPYVNNGLVALRQALKAFGNVIKQNLASEVSGVDLSHEERKRKSEKCYQTIMEFLPEIQDKCNSAHRDLQPRYRELVHLVNSKL